MKIGHLVSDTDAEGPGRRFAIWTSGCTLRCKGCCNPELLEEGGEERTVTELLALIADTPGIEGVSLLGGEPTEQPDLPELCAGIQALGLTVMLYSGYTKAELEGTPVLDHVDLLVDGRFDGRQLEAGRRWIGSRNQVLYALTDAYDPTDPLFTSPQSIEIRFDGEELVVNGWPDSSRKVVR